MEQTKKKDTTKNVYVPGSLEKKRAIIMYLLVGIFITLSMKEISEFEYAHLQQSIGRRIAFLLVLLANVVLLFIPIIKRFAIIILLAIIIVWGVLVYKAWNGTYYAKREDGALFLFTGIGKRCVDLFDLKVKVRGSENNPPDTWSQDFGQGGKGGYNGDPIGEPPQSPLSGGSEQKAGSQDEIKKELLE